MEFLNWRNLLVVFIFWGLIFSGAFFWQQQYSEQSEQIYKSAKKIIKKPPKAEFKFDKPTEEELKEIEQENFSLDLITVPIKRTIQVFQCPEESCKVLGKFDPGIELRFDFEKIEPLSKWLEVPWPNPNSGPKSGYIKTTDLEKAAQEAPPLPQVSLDVTEVQLEPAKPIEINPQTIVGIVCEFYNPSTRDTKTTRGSGVIITENGHILTARSIVDLNYLNEGLEDFQIKNCLVGSLPQSEPLPSVDAIQKLNAFVRIPILPFTAEVFYIPKEEGLSAYEKSWLDFSIIQISDLNPDAKFFGITKLPESFPFAPILISDIPKTNEPVLSFGFPSGTTVGHQADIRTLFIQGLLSHITNYWAGDKRYAEDLFMIETHLDTEDTAGGRFGSPIFWKGYIIGVHTVKQRESLQIFNMGAKAILENLYDNNVAIPLEVY